MSNTKSPVTTSYRICRTTEKKHLNGVITLIDLDKSDNTGIAVVYVKEERNGKLDWYVSAEVIVSTHNKIHWHALKPHIRHNGVKQNWEFTKIQEGENVPMINIGNSGGDNGKNYTTYIEYKLESLGGNSGSSDKQNDGTGTAGNGETGH